jgi:two-component system response regulator HydG
MSETEIPKAVVLVVDDEQDHAQVMCEALQRQGHRCDVTYNLAEAEAKLKNKSYDVIVTDLMMEGKKEGLEVLAKAKALTPPPQVILVSAHGDIPIAVQAMNQGAFGFIEKPLDLNHFRARRCISRTRCCGMNSRNRVGLRGLSARARQCSGF